MQKSGSEGQGNSGILIAAFKSIMAEKIKIYLTILISLLILISSDIALSANFVWDQTDWSGGVDQSSSGVAVHPGDQTGWSKFFSKDTYTDISTPGGISISHQPLFWTQTSDIGDFDMGMLTNLRLIGQGTSSNTRYEETSQGITKTGTWPVTTDVSASGGSYTYSNTINSTLSFTFTGTMVSWIGMKTRTAGIANVYLDGEFQGSVDLYRSTAQFQQVLWSVSGLINASHTLKIEVSGQKNPGSSNTYVFVDAFDVVIPDPDNGAYLELADGVTTGTYESPTFDAGSDGGIFLVVSWNAAIPAGASLRFQIATNTDNQTWNFVGPDGTSNTFYENPGAAIYSGHDRTVISNIRPFEVTFNLKTARY